MPAADIIKKTQAYVEEIFGVGDTVHDSWHLKRVHKLAKRIAERESKADMLVVELSALLHDIADYKTGVTDEAAALQACRQWLMDAGLDTAHADAVMAVVGSIGFRGGHGVPQTTLEAQIVSDADQLDAIGAIGIARCFGYGGAHNRPMHDPTRTPQSYRSIEDYKNNDSPSVAHFYEKLLLLKDRLHTETAKQIAQHRHEYMEQFLDEFYAEWDGKR